ncbi:hypothetical protein ACLBWZ_10385 [Brucellaceae bacterium C25G]
MLNKIFLIIITYVSLLSDMSYAEDKTETMNHAVDKINKMYDLQASGCVEILNLEEPGIQCSGIFIHGIEPGQQHVWIPNPEDPRQSVSFSYLRSDIPTTLLYGGSGFIYDQTNREDNTKRLTLYCFYPFDSFSSEDTVHPAKSHGCGFPDKPFKSANTGDFESCSSVSVNTSDAWISRFLVDGAPELFVPDGCSFSPNHQSGFLNVIDVQIKSKSPYWNELITETWDETTAHRIPVIAFFYSKDDLKSKREALYYQNDYCKMYNKYVPVVMLDLDKKVQKAFSVKKEDQLACF